MQDTLSKQLAFLHEIDRLKTIIRRSPILDRSRRENSAEHSWHLAMYAIVLAEHANEPVNVDRVIKMLLIHDLVEIYAGDTWLYDTTASTDQRDKEAKAAQKLFGMLPADQAGEFSALWQEFEHRRSPEAAYAASIDALQPLANHLLSGEPDADAPARQDVLNRKRHIDVSSHTLWQLAESIIEESTEKGLYLRTPA